MVASSSTSSPSSSSSSSSSSGHCQREEKGMGKFESLHLRHPPAPPPPPPPPSHCKVTKHHRHRHHSYPPPSHCRHHSVEHPHCSPPLGFPSHQHHLPAPMDCAHHHPHKKDKLRVKPPKHLKKVHKLHRYLLKAYRLPKGARHGGHRHHHMHFPPPMFTTLIGQHHPPVCCLHSMDKERFSKEEPCHQQETSILPRHHPRCHGKHRLPPQPTHPLIKSDVVGGTVALRNPRGAEASAEPPVEGGVPPAFDMPEEPGPVMQTL